MIPNSDMINKKRPALSGMLNSKLLSGMLLFPHFGIWTHTSHPLASLSSPWRHPKIPRELEAGVPSPTKAMVDNKVLGKTPFLGTWKA